MGGPEAYVPVFIQPWTVFLQTVVTRRRLLQVTLTVNCSLFFLFFDTHTCESFVDPFHLDLNSSDILTAISVAVALKAFTASLMRAECKHRQRYTDRQRLCQMPSSISKHCNGNIGISSLSNCSWSVLRCVVLFPPHLIIQLPTEDQKASNV